MQFLVKMPKLSPTMEEGIIAHWHKKEGEFVAAGEVLLEITTDKATLEHHALDAGWLRKILAQEGSSLAINQPLAIFTEDKEERVEESATTSQAEDKEEEKKELLATTSSMDDSARMPGRASESIVPPISPFARKLAQEHDLDLTQVKGSGPGGRITSRDLPATHLSSTQERMGEEEQLPLSPTRLVIAKRLQEAKSSIPHFYVQQLIDATALLSLREALLQTEAGQKQSLTVTDLLIRGCAKILKKFPEVNSGFNSKTNTLIRYKQIDLSLAVSIEGGLITPIIRNADQLSLWEIARSNRALGEKARQGKLTPQEYQGGSFTLSNLGMYGVTGFAAILNPPQAAILAVGAIQEAPVVRGGELAVGSTLLLTLSADHRVIDGALAARFLKALQAQLEEPLALAIVD